MKRILLIFCAVASATTLLFGCDNLGEPRTLPTPSFEARKIFPNIDGAAQPGQRGGAFEDRVAEMMAGEDGPDETTTRSIQLVPLGASLVAEVPEDSDAWRWSRQGGRTLISMTPPGEHAEILILTRDYTMAAARSPSQEFRKFVVDVDPTLGSGLDIGQLLEQAQFGQLPIGALADADGEIAIDDLLDLFAGAATMTGGRGLGYRSAPGSFSGWRWVGQNNDDVTLRVATSHGNWGPQPELPAGLDPATLQRIVNSAAEAPAGGTSSIDLGDLGLDIEGALETLGGVGSGGGTTDMPDTPTPARITSSTRPDTSRARIPTRPAQMYLGQAELTPNRGVYVFILCAAQGHCPHAGELAAFLDRMRVEESPPSGRQVDFDVHAESLGLYFQE